MTRTYNNWAGNPKGTPENIKKCIKSVWPRGEWFSHQCTRDRGFGLDGLYCKQHAKDQEAKEE